MRIGPHLGQLRDPEESPPSGLRILILEEDEDARQSLADFLRKHGHHVQIVSDGPEGLRSIRVTTPDVVLLSGDMYQKDRQQVAEWLTERAVGKRPFFIALTDHASSVEQHAMDKAPIDLYLNGPLNARLLQRVLSRLQDILMPEAREWSRDVGEVEFQPVGVR
jgi:DNA-binding response OmpR family regulator